MGLIDTYQIATLGINSRTTYTTVSNGILIKIQIGPVPPTPLPGGGSSYGYRDGKEIKDKKKITVTALIDGIEYIESVIVEDRPNLTIKDFDVEVVYNDLKPKITVTFKS